MSTTTVPTVEDLVGVATTAATYVACHPLPPDSSIDIHVTNYDGQDEWPTLNGSHVNVHVRTADADWVEGLRAAIFGVPTDGPAVRYYGNSQITTWTDSWRCKVEWNQRVTAEVSR